MYVPKKSLPIRETSLAGKQDPVSMTPNSAKHFPGLMAVHSRTSNNHGSRADWLCCRCLIVLVFATGEHRTTPFILTQLFHPPTTPCDLASKPEHLESDYILQTPLSLMNQVIKPILMQTGVLPVTLVLFCA
jgi:hypothetical protein